jgi:hypothetical protein
VWSNVPPGNYALTAVAIDNNGYTATSSVVNLFISPLFASNNLAMWLNAGAITNLANGAPIANWPDISGNSNNAVQSNTAYEPSYITNALNGLPVVHFNGSCFYLPAATGMLTGTGAEAFVVLRAGGSREFLWSLGTGGGGSYPNGAGQIVDDFGSTVQNDVGTPPEPLNQFNVYQVSAQTGNWAAWINGVLQYQTAINTFAASSSTMLGAVPGYGSYFNGDIAEMMLFNRPLSVGERLTVNEYLNSKYGLVPAIAAAPTNLVADAVSTSQISLTWDEVLNGGSTQMSLERSTASNGMFTVIAQVADAQSYVDTNLSAGTTYYYQVRAENAGQWSGYSDVAPATTLTVGTDLPFGSLAMWLKADAGVAEIGTNTPVQLWADQSGNGNNAIQTASAYQPVWTANAIGDRPVVHFNGSSSYSYLNLPSASGMVTTGAEAFVVLRSSSVPSYLWRMGGSGGLIYYPDSSGQITEDFGSLNEYNLGIPAQPLNQYHLYNVSAQTGNWAAWVNGILLYQTTTNTFAMSGASGGATTLGNVSGYGAYFNGDIAEVMLFKRPLSGDERDTVGNYLFSKYGLQQFAASTAAPSTPTNLMSVGLAPNQLSLQWQPGSANAYSFHVERELGTNGVFQEIGASYFNNVVDTTASPTSVYYYRVKAHNLFGDSGYSALISPPTVTLTNWPSAILENETNLIVPQTGDAQGAVTNVELFAALNFNLYFSQVSTANTNPFTLNWSPTLVGNQSVAALATDSLGNSQFSAPFTFTVYLDANGDRIPDVWEVQNGNNPMNPWLAPAFNTNDHTAPVITLLIPTNAIVVP